MAKKKKPAQQPAEKNRAVIGRGRRSRPPNPSAEILTVRQAADRCNVSRATADRLIRSGKWPHIVFRKGRRHKLIGVPLNLLDQWIRKNTLWGFD
jgi:excisionase family DNA binding protein